VHWWTQQKNCRSVGWVLRSLSALQVYPDGKKLHVQVFSSKCSIYDVAFLAHLLCHIVLYCYHSLCRKKVFLFSCWWKVWFSYINSISTQHRFCTVTLSLQLASLDFSVSSLIIICHLIIWCFADVIEEVIFLFRLTKDMTHATLNLPIMRTMLIYLSDVDPLYLYWFIYLC